MTVPLQSIFVASLTIEKDIVSTVRFKAVKPNTARERSMWSQLIRPSRSGSSSVCCAARISSTLFTLSSADWLLSVLSRPRMLAGSLRRRPNLPGPENAVDAKVLGCQPGRAYLVPTLMDV
jgi:hypothetical protein